MGCKVHILAAINMCSPPLSQPTSWSTLWYSSTQYHLPNRSTFSFYIPFLSRLRSLLLPTCSTIPSCCNCSLIASVLMQSIPHTPAIFLLAVSFLLLELSVSHSPLAPKILLHSQCWHYYCIIHQHLHTSTQFSTL